MGKRVRNSIRKPRSKLKSPRKLTSKKSPRRSESARSKKISKKISGKNSKKDSRKFPKKTPQLVSRKASGIGFAQSLFRRFRKTLGISSTPEPRKTRGKSILRTRKLSLSRMQVREEKDRQEPIVQEPVSAAPVTPTSPTTTAPAPLLSPPPLVATPAIAQRYEGQSLSTLDILKPQDKLKDSIAAFLLDQRSPHTRRAYGKDLKRFVQFLHLRNHKQGVESLTRTTLIAYKESLVTEGLEHTTVDRHLATLRSFFNWLVEDGHLVKSPADGVRFLNPKRLSPTIGFSDEEVRKVLSLPDLHTRTGSQHYAILMVLFYCGLRRSELCGLTFSNLGTERNQHVLRLRGKGNAERVIVMIQPVWSALQHYFYIAGRNLLNHSPDDFIFSPFRNNRTGTVKKPLDTSTIFYLVTKYARQAGIANRVSPHSCRATAISNARDHKVPDRAIQEFAGWASPDMITRYDKRKSAIEDSAAHSISYGNESRSVPSSLHLTEAPRLPEKEPPEPEASG